MKRNKHNLSNYRLLTLDAGYLVPIGLAEVLPGDSFDHGTSVLLRASPLAAPVMHPVEVRVHHWFVPHRMSWEVAQGTGTFEDFITGGRDGNNSASVPTANAPASTGYTVGSLADYLGLPTGVPDFEFSKLPMAAYLQIWNEYYRDNALTAPATGISTLRRIAWEKDYFTAARPFAQLGPEVTLPLGNVANVIPKSPDNVPKFQAGIADFHLQADGTTITANTTTGGGPNDVGWLDPRLEVDLSTATAASVLDVRRAFALQRYAEARARYGSRYTEYLAYLGVRAADSRLQRPEYLGGGKQTISFSEVLQTSPDMDAGDSELSGVGQMKGHGITALRSNTYRKFFSEHGYIMSLMSIRPKAMYMNGVHRHWLKSTREEFWQKELEQIGQQDVYKGEIFTVNGSETDSFGFQDRYAEYRHIPAGVSGEFRDTLNYWHWARSFASAPTLNTDFIQCDPGKRIFQEQTSHSFLAMVSHRLRARRLVSRNASGRIY